MVGGLINRSTIGLNVKQTIGLLYARSINLFLRTCSKFLRLKKLLAFFITCHLFLSAASQMDSSRLRISLLTCGPGQDLYSIWGHTGVRVIDSVQHTDVVFNYGTFDDRDPLFYVKFTRGIMLYSVTPYSFPDFMEEYKFFRRSVTEQVLDLDEGTKIKLQKALWKNTEDQYKFYPYHFYADNCTTRARDMLMNNIDPALTIKNIRPDPVTSTYRQLIHSYMNSSGQAWNRFGIDVLLGNHLDEPMNNRQAMFLPEFLLKALDSAALLQHPLVTKKLVLLPDEQPDDHNFFTPVVVFSLLLVIMITLSFVNKPVAEKTLLALDRLFFLFTGLLGLLMLTLWIARVDNVCRNNYNLLWALPTHLVIAFVVTKEKLWVKYYFLFTVILNMLLLLAWNWLPQEMNNSILLAITILIFRSFARYRKIKRV